MTEKMNQLLETIKKDIIFMANEVEDAIYKSLKALKKQDKKIAQDVIKGDKKIDKQEVDIENQILALLALQQPVAVDLRFIVGALKMNNDLERIGDHATNIAEIAIELSGEPYLKALEDIPKMGKISRGMLHDAVLSFINGDSDLASDVIARDNEVDNLYYTVRDEVVALLRDHKDKIKQGVFLISVARDLERVADLATNLCEDVVFMKEARIIRHGFDKESK
ncbi:phosphate transport system regulatory protein PhoU [candidate division KSB1 bacterium RBG_16_48_16]|nr:MAG: phosphate transport system regulatory protein PhoU [candidate division KSB1 bacterium RBG_16_48_16]